MKGLVLEGGGAKGAYHIGVYKAMLEEGIEVQGVAGTSIGALNGAMIIQGDYERCYDLWYDLRYSMLIDANDDEMARIRQLKMGKEDLGLLAENLRNLIGNKGFDISPFKELLNEYIDEDKIREANKDLGIVTINLTDLKPMEIYLEDIPKGQLKNYLMASAYLPIFKMERLEGKIYLDGGFYDNLPFRMLEAKGYKDLIIVRTHARGITRRINLSNINCTIISPSEDLGRSFTYEADRARQNLELGYYDGLRAFRGLVGSNYYIEPKIEKDYYLNILLSLTEEQVEDIAELMKLPFIYYRRTLFEYILPKLSSLLGLNKNNTYEDIIVGLLEKKLEDLGINKYEIYNFDELLITVKKIERIKEGIKENNIEETSKLEKLMEIVDLNKIFNKDETLVEVFDIIFKNH